MHDVIIDDSWYDPLNEQKTIISLLQKIITQQEKETVKLNLIEQQLDYINTRLSQLENKERNISNALHELKVLKEREINILIREHIPFPFKNMSPISRLPFRKPFHQKKEDPDL